jgi:hypothetical protein
LEPIRADSGFLVANSLVVDYHHHCHHHFHCRHLEQQGLLQLRVSGYAVLVILRSE